jgi:hypothetical protein
LKSAEDVAFRGCGKLQESEKKEKRSKKQRKGRPVETAAPVEKPSNKRSAFPQFPQARRRSIQQQKTKNQKAADPP